jgi:hypothetical protein
MPRMVSHFTSIESGWTEPCIRNRGIEFQIRSAMRPRVRWILYWIVLLLSLSILDLQMWLTPYGTQLHLPSATPRGLPHAI